MRRPSLRKLAVAAGVLLAGLVVLPVWGSSRLQARAAAELVRALSDASGARASVSSVALSLAGTTLVAREIELKDGTRTLVRAQELRAQTSWAGVLRGRPQLRSLTLAGVRATLTLADLQRMGSEMERDSAAAADLQLPAADLTVDFGPAGALHVPRGDLAFTGSGNARQLTLAPAPAEWLRARKAVARARLALRCELGRGSAASLGCTPRLDAVEIGGTLGSRMPSLSAAAEVRADSGRWIAENLRVRLPRGELAGRAEFAPSGQLALELRSPALDLADLEALAGTRVEGRGRVELRVRPESSPLLVAASVTLEGVAIGGVKLGALSAELALERAGAGSAVRVLRIARAQASAPDRKLSTRDAVLELDVDGLVAARAELAIEHLPLAELYRSIGAGSDPMLARLQARSSGTAELEYRRSGAAGQLALGLSLQLSAASLLEYPFGRGQLRAHLSLADARAGMAQGRIELKQLSLAAGRGALELSGKLERGVLAMQLATRGKQPVPLGSWPWLAAHAPKLSGDLLLRGALSGTSERPRADLSVEVQSLAYREQALGGLQLTAALADGPVVGSGCTAQAAGRALRICGAGLAGQLRVDVAVADAPDRAVRGRIELEQLALRPFLPLSAAGKPSEGALSATVAVTGGGLAQPARLTGVARVRELVVGEGEARLASTAPFELRADVGQLSLRGAELKGREMRVALSAAGSLGEKPRLVAEGTVAAGVFTRSTEPLVQAFGDVAVRMQWSLTETPAVRGRVDVRDLVVRVGTARVRKLQGALAVEGERLTLDGVSAELGGGRIALTGQLGLGGLRLASYDLALSAERVALEPDPLIHVELDAQNRLRWSGANATPELSGHVKLRRLSYRKQLHAGALTQLTARPAAATGEDRLRLDLTIEHEEPLRIRNSLIDGELSSRSLRVVGSDRRLGLIGELAMTRGRLMFQGDEFEVQRGRIEFSDPKRIAPKFDLLAIAAPPRRPQAKVVLSARGTDTAFDVDVRCDAPPASALPPFQCQYRGARMACDALDRLVAQFVCNPAK